HVGRVLQLERPALVGGGLMSTQQLPDPQQWGPGAAPHNAAPASGNHRIERAERAKARVRMIGSAIIVALAMITAFALAPQTDADSGSTADRFVVWSDDEANQARTQGAPQQTVVNGWTGN